MHRFFLLTHVLNWEKLEPGILLTSKYFRWSDNIGNRPLVLLIGVVTVCFKSPDLIKELNTVLIHIYLYSN